MENIQNPIKVGLDKYEELFTKVFDEEFDRLSVDRVNSVLTLIESDQRHLNKTLDNTIRFFTRFTLSSVSTYTKYDLPVTHTDYIIAGIITDKVYNLLMEKGVYDKWTDYFESTSDNSKLTKTHFKVHIHNLVYKDISHYFESMDVALKVKELMDNSNLTTFEGIHEFIRELTPLLNETQFEDIEVSKYRDKRYYGMTISLKFNYEPDLNRGDFLSNPYFNRFACIAGSSMTSHFNGNDALFDMVFKVLKDNLGVFF